MLYFDVAEPLKGLGYEEKGRLLEAMLDYGQFGVVPEFVEGHLTIAWGFIRPKLDADAKSYWKKVVRNSYSSYCAKAKKNGVAKVLDFEEWCNSEGIDTTTWVQAVPTDTDRCRSVPTDADRYPTTTPKPSTKSNTEPKPSATSKSKTSTKTNSTTEAKANPDGGGKRGEAPPNETEEQMRQRKMDLARSYRP